MVTDAGPGSRWPGGCACGSAQGIGAAVVDAIARATARFGLPAAAPVRSCYEAGRDGFWPHRFLALLGVDNLVVDSSSIEVPRRQRRAKTDRIDGEKLWQLLRRHWVVSGRCGRWCRCPPGAGGCAARQSELDHAAARADAVSQPDPTVCWRCTACGSGWTRSSRPAWRRPAIGRTRRCRPGCRHGCSRRGGCGKPWRWSGGRSAPPSSRGCGRPATPVLAMAQRLTRVQGIAARSATVLAEALFSRDLRNRRQVGALCGLVSAPFQSGTRRHDQGLTGSGLPAVRRIAVEIAWAWVRFQPQHTLTQWYQARFGSGRRRGAPHRHRRAGATGPSSPSGAMRRPTVLPEGTVLKA